MDLKDLSKLWTKTEENIISNFDKKALLSSKIQKLLNNHTMNEDEQRKKVDELREELRKLS